MDIQEAREWLQKLDREIHFYHPPGRYHVGYNQLLRSVADGEWALVTEIILEHELPCEVRGQVYSFGFTVRDRQDYLPGEPGEILLYVEHSQFPFASAKDGVRGQLPTLQEIEPITHRLRNHELLEWYGIRPLDPRIEQCVY